MVSRIFQNLYLSLNFICISLVFIGCKGCNSLGKNLDSFTEKNRKVVIVLIDYSASNSDEVLNNYISIITSTILPNLSQYDCLVVVPIDEGAKMQPVKLVNIDLADTSFKKPTDGFAHANDSLNLRFRNYVREMAPKIELELREQKVKRKVYTSHTDILGALQQTTNLLEFNSRQETLKSLQDFVLGHIKLKSQNIIVILSDMIQDSNEFSFNSKNGVTYPQTNDYIKALEKQSRIPGLDSCTLFAIGATGKNSMQIDNICFFWKQYFKAAKADLQAYGFNVNDKLRKYLKQTSN